MANTESTYMLKKKGKQEGFLLRMIPLGVTKSVHTHKDVKSFQHSPHTVRKAMN